MLKEVVEITFGNYIQVQKSGSLDLFFVAIENALGPTSATICFSTNSNLDMKNCADLLGIVGLNLRARASLGSRPEEIRVCFIEAHNPVLSM